MPGPLSSSTTLYSFIRRLRPRRRRNLRKTVWNVKTAADRQMWSMQQAFLRQRRLMKLEQQKDVNAERRRLAEIQRLDRIVSKFF